MRWNHYYCVFYVTKKQTHKNRLIDFMIYTDNLWRNTKADLKIIQNFISTSWITLTRIAHTSSQLISGLIPKLTPWHIFPDGETRCKFPQQKKGQIQRHFLEAVSKMGKWDDFLHLSLLCTSVSPQKIPHAQSSTFYRLMIPQGVQFRFTNETIIGASCQRASA